MIVGATLGGTAVSLAAVGYLAATDPKRRRAFRLAPVSRRHGRLGWTAVLVPGAVVAWLGGGGGFLVWFGTVTVVGWGLAAVRPEGTGALRQAVGMAVARARGLGAGLAGRVQEVFASAVALRPARGAGRMDRVAALEARVAALEAELAALRHGGDVVRPGGVVVELAMPARR